MRSYPSNGQIRPLRSKVSIYLISSDVSLKSNISLFWAIRDLLIDLGITIWPRSNCKQLLKLFKFYINISNYRGGGEGYDINMDFKVQLKSLQLCSTDLWLMRKCNILDNVEVFVQVSYCTSVQAQLISYLPAILDHLVWPMVCLVIRVDCMQ